METKFHKSTGVSLLFGSVLAIVTMVLHPVGGNLEYLIKTAGPIKFAHGLAILCIPFILFGFYGLTIKLLDKWKFSMLAYILVVLSFVSALLAALFNGIILPSYLTEFADNLEQYEDTLELITHFSFAINKALDYVFIIGVCFSITLYSIIIIRTKKLNKWIGYFGILITLLFLYAAIANYAFTSLNGFRFFVFSIVSWIILAAIFLIKKSNP